MQHKSEGRELALFGGRPAFPQGLHVGRPNGAPTGEVVGRLLEILERNIFTNDGPEVRALEGRMRELTGARQAVAVTNATIGLQIVARALNLRGRILVPSFTFVATAHAFEWLGLEPVFCDIDPATHNLDPALVEKFLVSGVCAVVGVHVWGRLCAPLELEALCRKHAVPLIFDAAHALGCGGYGRAVGTFGTAEVFSLHATKICHSFEGGVITTNDDGLADRIRRMRNFGFTGYDQVGSVGINGKMSEISAAMGRISLGLLEDYREVNRRNAAVYARCLPAALGFQWVESAPGEVSNHHYIVAQLDGRWPADARDLLVKALHAEGVLVRRYFSPGCHRMEPYRAGGHGADERLRHTEALCERVLCFPNGTALTNAEIEEICRLTALALDRLSEIRELVRTSAS